MLQLPELPNLPGLRPQIAAGGDTAQTPLLAPLAVSGAQSGVLSLPVVRTGRTTPAQPGKPVGVVLFTMAAAAAAAASARFRMGRAARHDSSSGR
jgi:hypothetical protein